MSPTTAAMAAQLVAEGAPPESAQLAAGLLLDRLRYPEGGGVPCVIDRHGHPALAPDGSAVTVSDLIASLRVEIPQLFGAVRPVAAPPTPPGRETLTERAAREHRERQAVQSRQASGEPMNPWAKGSLNITQQVLISNRNPEQAAKLKAEAGVR